MIWMLFGRGANRFEMPCRVWLNKKRALADCKRLFGEPSAIDDDVYQWHNLSKEKVKKLFTSYSDGCGGCYDVFLTTVEEGQPFVHWDLD